MFPQSLSQLLRTYSRQADSCMAESGLSLAQTFPALLRGNAVLWRRWAGVCCVRALRSSASPCTGRCVAAGLLTATWRWSLLPPPDALWAWRPSIWLATSSQTRARLRWLRCSVGKDTSARRLAHPPPPPPSHRAFDDNLQSRRGWCLIEGSWYYQST